MLTKYCFHNNAGSIRLDTLELLFCFVPETRVTLSPPMIVLSTIVPIIVVNLESFSHRANSQNNVNRTDFYGSIYAAVIHRHYIIIDYTYSKLCCSMSVSM